MLRFLDENKDKSSVLIPDTFVAIFTFSFMGLLFVEHIKFSSMHEKRFLLNVEQRGNFKKRNKKCNAKFCLHLLVDLRAKQH